MPTRGERNADKNFDFCRWGHHTNFNDNKPLDLGMQIAHFRSHVIPLRNVLLFKYLHMKESTPKSTITWPEVYSTLWWIP